MNKYKSKILVLSFQIEEDVLLGFNNFLQLINVLFLRDLFFPFVEILLQIGQNFGFFFQFVKVIRQHFYLVQKVVSVLQFLVCEVVRKTEFPFMLILLLRMFVLVVLFSLFVVQFLFPFLFQPLQTVQYFINQFLHEWAHLFNVCFIKGFDHFDRKLQIFFDVFIFLMVVSEEFSQCSRNDFEFLHLLPQLVFQWLGFGKGLDFLLRVSGTQFKFFLRFLSSLLLSHFDEPGLFFGSIQFGPKLVVVFFADGKKILFIHG